MPTSRATVARTFADVLWRIAGTGDFDGDGKSDVLRTVADQEWKIIGLVDYGG